MRVSLSIVLILALAGCVDSPQQGAAMQSELPAATGPDAEAEHRERIQEAWRGYEAALREGDAESAVSIFAEDITIRGRSYTLQGRATYLERIEGFVSNTTLDYLRGEVEDVIVMDDHVFSAGTWSERWIPNDAPDEPAELSGDYAWLWRLEDDGEWRIAHFIWNQAPDAEQ